MTENVDLFISCEGQVLSGDDISLLKAQMAAYGIACDAECHPLHIWASLDIFAPVMRIITSPAFAEGVFAGLLSAMMWDGIKAAVRYIRDKFVTATHYTPSNSKHEPNIQINIGPNRLVIPMSLENDLIEKAMDEFYASVQEHPAGQDYYASNPDIDPARTHRNFHLLYPTQHYRAEAERQIKEAECRVRTDSTRLVEVLFTVSTGYFDDKFDDEIRAYYERSLDFLRAHQTDATILSAVVHMDEGTPHMHVVFVPLTPDHRLSAKDIIGNRKKLIQWQDQYYDYMAAKYPDLSRGESAAKTGRKHMSVKEFKAMTKDIKEMLNMADEIGKLLDGANLFNAQGRLGQLVPLFQKLLPHMGKMKTQLKQYGTAFTDTAAENEQLKKENTRLSRENRQERDEAIAVRSELSRVQSDYRRLERKVANIPPEILTRYAPDIHLKDQSI